MRRRTLNLRTVGFFTLAVSLCATGLGQTPASEQKREEAPATMAVPDRTCGTEPSKVDSAETGNPDRNHRMLWIIPNARSQPISAQSHPLSTHEKWQLVKRDALDPSSVLMAGAVGGLGMTQGLHHEFGWGPAGAAKYWSAALAGQEVGKVMTGGVFPTLLHQDPRFFTRGSGSVRNRIGYALSRELITRGDNGKPQFNTSEMAGVAVAASFGNIYYTRSRGAGTTAVRFGEQIGINAGFNVLKEFWPSIQKRMARKK